MNHRPSDNPKRPNAKHERAVRDRLVNECLDSIVEGDAGLARAMIRASSEVVPGADRDVAEMRRLLRPLTKLPTAPDLSARILAETHRRRPFLSGLVRHRISIWRVSLAASFLLLITGGYLLTGSMDRAADPLSSADAPLASVSPAESLHFSLLDALDDAPPILVTAAPYPKRVPLPLSAFNDRTPQRRWDVSPVATDSVVTSAAVFRSPVSAGRDSVPSSRFASAFDLGYGPTMLPPSSLLWSGGTNTSMLKASPLPTWWFTGPVVPDGRSLGSRLSTVGALQDPSAAREGNVLGLPRIDLRRVLSKPH